jgi:hypothetical protein
MPDTGQTANVRAVIWDVLTGAVELLALFVTVTTTAVALPPGTAPMSRYQHVVSIYSTVVTVTVLAALVAFVSRRRWAAAAIQVLVVLATGASVLFLHHTRLSGGLTGY